MTMYELQSAVQFIRVPTSILLIIIITEGYMFVQKPAVQRVACITRHQCVLQSRHFCMRSFSSTGRNGVLTIQEDNCHWVRMPVKGTYRFSLWTLNWLTLVILMQTEFYCPVHVVITFNVGTEVMCQRRFEWNVLSSIGVIGPVLVPTEWYSVCWRRWSPSAGVRASCSWQVGW